MPDAEGVGVVKAVHHILGAKLESRGWLVNVEGYLKNTEGKMNLFAQPVNTGANWMIIYFPQLSRERNKGIDLFVQKRHGIFNHMVGYSVSKMEEQIEGVLNDNWFPGYNDRLHQLKLTEMANWKSWSITGSWQFGTGLPIVNLTTLNQNFYRSNYFSQLDFALVKKFNTPHLSVDAGVSMLNVLNRKNIVEVDYLRFSSETGSLTVRSDISALAFTPVFFLNFKLQ